MATTASTTATDHLVNSISSSTSTKTSLFDRVANFRRSLIKSQQKKNKIRPSSGSFNFFKPNSSSNLTDSSNGSKNGSTNQAPVQLESVENGHHGSNGISSSASHVRHSIIVDEEDAIYGFTSLHLSNQTSLRRQLKQVVDNSNKQQQHHPQTSSSSSPSQLFTSSSCISLYETIDEVEPISVLANSASSSESSSSESKQAPLPQLPPLNPKQHFQQKLRGANSSRQLRITAMHDSDWKRNRRSSAIIFGSDFHDLMIDDSDEPSSLHVPADQAPVNGYHSQQPKLPLSANPLHSLHLHHQLNRSSDDLLLMSKRQYHHQHDASIGTESSRASDPVSKPSLAINARIYENLNHSHHHHKRGDTNRKLTKDSGYESASTLVSLTQLNGCNSQQFQPQPSPKPPTPLPPISSAGSTPPKSHRQNGSMISPHPHCRSNSMDSANSLCGDLQSPSPSIPKCQSESPPFPPAPSVEIDDDSRPPTPPVRFSSLPQNRSFLHRHHLRGGESEAVTSSPHTIQQLWQPSFDNFDHQQLERLSATQLCGFGQQQSSSPPLPPPPPASTELETTTIQLEYRHMKQDSWPSFRSGTLSGSSPLSNRRRHAAKSMLLPSDVVHHAGPVACSEPYQPYQRQQSYPAKPYSVSGKNETISQSPSLSSLSNMITGSTSVRHSIASCGINGYSNYQVVPAQQIARSHRVQQAPRQELCTPALPAPKHRASLETSLDDFDTDEFHSSPPPPPPPLPPKNFSHSPINSGDTAQNSTSDLKLASRPSTQFSPDHSPPASSSEIKAIQKRAVYEFYLRQKEKKEKAMKSSSSSSSESPSRSNSGSSLASSTATLTPPIVNGVTSNNTNEQSKSKEQQNIVFEEELPLPTPPPPLPLTDAPDTIEQTNQFFPESDSSDNSFPPPPTPVATESPAFPPPPTPSSPTFPPPPTPTTTTVQVEPIVPIRVPQMYHSIDLSTLWPLIDLSRLLQPLPMPPKESNLNDEDADKDEDDEELVSIEAARERQQAFDWRQAQLTAELGRIELELERNESIVGQLVRARLSSEDVDRNKLELLCNDMIMITRLMVSIVQQLTRNEQQQSQSAKVLCSDKTASESETKERGTSNDANDVVNNHGIYCSAGEVEATTDVCQQKRIRLWRQLEEAKRLRDNIETRRTMLEQRLARKCAAKNGNNYGNGCGAAVQSDTNHSSMMITSTSAANGAPDGYLATTGQLLLSDDIDLTTLIRYYLTNKEHLLVLAEVGKLLQRDLESQLN